MKRRLSMCVLLLALSVPLRGAQERQQGGPFEWSQAIEAGAWLRVYSFSGPIDVSPADGDVAEVRGETRGDDSEIYFEVVPDGADFILCVMGGPDADCERRGIDQDQGWFPRLFGGFGPRRRNASVELTIELPRGVRIEVASGTGDVKVRDATAEVRASSGNGEVRVADSAGPVRATSGNGRVEVLDAEAPVEASSGNGRIRITTTSGPVNASSGNGDINVSIASLARPGEMRFSTGNGDIELTLPDDFGAELEASFGNGRVDSDLPLTVSNRRRRGRVDGTIGDGGPRLQVSSGNGNLELRVN